MKQPAGIWVLAAMGPMALAGCAAHPSSHLASTASLAPSPPGWFAFCAARLGAGDAACDPVPRATAMADGDRAAAPGPWLAYCQRHDGDPACSR